MSIFAGRIWRYKLAEGRRAKERRNHHRRGIEAAEQYRTKYGNLDVSFSNFPITITHPLIIEKIVDF